MNQCFTTLRNLFILIVLTGSYAIAQNTSGTPADTTKKKGVAAAPAAPAQLITYPLTLASGKFKLNGYTQVRYQYFTDTLVNNAFDVRRARITMSGSPFKNFDYRIQIDFCPTTRVMDMTAAYTLNPYLKISAGQQKIPFSLENIVSSPTMESINRSQVVEALVSRSRDVISSSANNNGRDIGVLASGSVKTQTRESRSILEYNLGLVNGTGINKSDNNRAVDFSGRLIFSPVKQLSVGGSYYNGSATYGTDLTEPKNRDRFGFELFYNSPRITVKSEFIQGEDSATIRNGYYIQLAGFLIPEKFQAMLKYDFYDSNTGKDDDASLIYSLGLNWFPAKYAKLQVAYDYRREEVSDAQIDNDLVHAMLQLSF